MARRRSPGTEPPPPAVLSPEQLKAAIPKLKRRIADLDQFDSESVNDRMDPRIRALESRIDDTLAEIFGPDTLDYQRYRRAAHLDRASINMMYATPLHELREGLHKGVADAKMTLKTVIDLFEEKLEDLGETEAGRTLTALDGLDLHPEVSRAATKLFRDGHYAEAVGRAVQTLILLVKMRSGRQDLDGDALMRHVFSLKAPLLRFNKLRDRTDEDEQRGMMELFAGAVAALRNPRAHNPLIKDSPERALEYIAFISLLAKRLDEAEQV